MIAIYSRLAKIFDYPVYPIAQEIEDCAAVLALEAPEANIYLLQFQNALMDKTLGEIQEIYTTAFDLRPDCTPNLSYHLFGDDGRRGLFLAELKGRMEAAGIGLGSELPDHLSLVLLYMESAESDCPTLIEDCMIPALSRMVETLAPTGNPYQHGLRALLVLFQHQHDAFSAGAVA